MVLFNSLLNLQPSRFAVWIKFYFCSGVNFWSSWEVFSPPYYIPGVESGQFAQTLLVQHRPMQKLV